ncbi:DUF6507 family protein [Streptomyces monticola]|uniref:DUF6507 family protein n=1 Tax=Streptomyces monticola TaxID=2666263 RepID=A0ABW2JBW2_9ACTN
MSRWDIQPAGVLGTLTMTGEAASRLETAVNAMVKDLSTAASSAGTVVPGAEYTPVQGPMAVGSGARPSVRQQETACMADPQADAQRPTVTVVEPVNGPVGGALSQYLESRMPKVQSMANRTANAINGAATATNHYQQGNTEMAANAQAKVVQAPEKIDMPGAGGERGAK